MSDRRRRASLVAALLLAAGAACFRGSLPALELYRLVLPEAPAMDGAEPMVPVERPVLEGALAIAPYRAPGIYGDPAIVYRIDDTRYGSYPSRRWALSLSLMLGQLTERVLAARPLSLVPAVYDPPSRAAHPFEWQATIREFEEVNREREVLVAVAFEVRIVRTADETIVWRGTTRVERAVADPTMPAIVDALSAGAAEAVAQAIADARAALAQSPPGVGR